MSVYLACWVTQLSMYAFFYCALLLPKRYNVSVARKLTHSRFCFFLDPVNEDNISDTFPSPASFSAGPHQTTPASAGRSASFTGSGSSTPSSYQPSLTDSSFQNSPTPEGSGLKRHKSLRKRLFGGKRKTNKNWWRWIFVFTCSEWNELSSSCTGRI